jgi:hypothetical protein
VHVSLSLLPRVRYDSVLTHPLCPASSYVRSSFASHAFSLYSDCPAIAVSAFWLCWSTEGLYCLRGVPVRGGLCPAAPLAASRLALRFGEVSPFTADD